MSVVSMIKSGFRLNSKKIQPILNSGIRRGAGNHPDAGSGIYRMDAPPGFYGPQIRIMKALQVLTWFHIFYNFWYDPDILLGHPSYQLPDANKWTDEELGIPPDDYNEVV